MPTISLCLIVKNEEKFLEQCLRSVQGLVDEIVVVDTGSTDTTKEIAASFTPKVFDFAWCDDFAAARNESLKYAAGDWVLILDADETLAEKDHLQITNLISAAPPAVSGFILTQRNYFRSMEDLSYGSFAGLHVSAAGGELGFISAKDDSYAESAGTIGWLPTPIVRLFRRETAAFSGRVHEDVSPSLKSKIINSAIPIHHYGKLSMETWKQKWKLYERLGERKAEEEKDYYAYFELGRQYLNGKAGTGELCLDAAQRMFERSLKLKPDFWLSWFNLGSVHLIQNNLPQAVFCLQKALEYNPPAPQIYLNLGVVYVKQKQYSDAERVFWQGIELNPQRADLFKNLGLCYLEMGKEREAAIVLKKAVELNPAYAENIHFGKKE
ncbi:tetratricopeptide repeat protein [Candidatus Woesearchaeota archaeon]|nr:tetratricopeptide repeat protein [Candidatus Woesearchaeota archaeon]